MRLLAPCFVFQCGRPDYDIGLCACRLTLIVCSRLRQETVSQLLSWVVHSEKGRKTQRCG